MSAPGDAPKSALKIPLAQGAVIHVAQIGLRPRFPFPRTDLSHSFRDGYSERGVAVQDGDADLVSFAALHLSRSSRRCSCGVAL